MKKILILVALLMIIGGCTEDGEVFESSNDMRLEPRFETSTLYHDYGEVTIGESVLTIITITSNSPFPEVIHSITLYGDIEFQIITPYSTPFWLANSAYGNSCDEIGNPFPYPCYDDIFEIEVAFTPSEEGQFRTTLVILDGTQKIIDLIGIGVCPILTPDEQVEELISILDSYIEEGSVDEEGSESLYNQLDQALEYLCTGNPDMAIQKLGVFIDIVIDKTPDRITEEASSEMISQAEAIIELIESGDYELDRS